MMYATQTDFENFYNAYLASLSEKKDSGRNIKSQTNTRKQLDNQINLAVKEVKVYIEKKFKKANAPGQFARYGIVNKNGYVLPVDKDVRLGALPLMIKAIAEDGFDKEEYGTAFWTKMLDDYNKTLEESGSTIETVSNKTSTKNVAKKELKKIMTSLLLILKGNYPDTYKSVYIEWGFIKGGY